MSYHDVFIPMLEFSSFSKSYNGNEVVSAPDMLLPEGVYWLKGENGSGKSTLIKSVAGLIPFDGTIKVAGTDIRTERVAYQKRVNYGEAEPLYPAFLTGTELINFVQQTRGHESVLDVKELMDIFGVSQYAHQKTGTYSSGMAKKLSLVLAMLGKPTLILLDEPLVTLDQNAVTILVQQIARLHALGVSFLITSHQHIGTGQLSFNMLGIHNHKLHNPNL